MRMAMLVPIAVLGTTAAAAGPANAERWTDPSFVAAAAVTVHRGSDHANRPRPGRDKPRHHRGRDRGPDISYVSTYNSGEWALWNNRNWEPSSYNDWWHDRPDRSFPRWMQANGNCERQWQGGGVWRC